MKVRKPNQIISENSVNIVKKSFYKNVVLFAALVNSNANKCWKTRGIEEYIKEENTILKNNFNKYFCVGINTRWHIAACFIPIKYWEYFNCSEIDKIPNDVDCFCFNNHLKRIFTEFIDNDCKLEFEE